MACLVQSGEKLGGHLVEWNVVTIGVGSSEAPQNFLVP